MSEQQKSNNQAEDLNQETMSFNDSCAAPVITQVDSADLKNGIVEISDKEE